MGGRWWWWGGRRSTSRAALDQPPSLAVALVQLVAGLGAGVGQRRHLVEQGVVGRLAEQRHQQGHAEASGALALHVAPPREERMKDRRLN